MEHGLTTVYTCIPNSMQAKNRNGEENINLIAQTIDQYRKDIEYLKETLNPMNPPQVIEQKNQEDAFQIGDMEKQVNTVSKLFDGAMHLQTVLKEEEKVQQWDQEEERESTSIQQLRKKKKTMSFTECLKGNMDLKKLQVELKVVQIEKQERQEEVEPLQEQEAQMIS